MKLLLDENLSPKLAKALANEFPDTTHIELLGLRGSSDRTVWEVARDEGYTIVSKDNDFRQRSFLYGPPPKVVWLSVGNAGSAAIMLIFRQHGSLIRRFVTQAEEGLLVLRASGS